jgi:hypothetical protein
MITLWFMTVLPRTIIIEVQKIKPSHPHPMVFDTLFSEVYKLPVGVCSGKCGYFHYFHFLYSIRPLYSHGMLVYKFAP